MDALDLIVDQAANEFCEYLFFKITYIKNADFPLEAVLDKLTERAGPDFADAFAEWYAEGER